MVGAMIRLLKQPILFRVLGLAVPAILLLAFALVPRFRPSGMMASRMGSQLSKIPDQLVERQVEQIAQLGLSGTRVLVQALDHRRKLVARSAASALHAQLDRWERLSPNESGPRVARLARMLVEHMQQFDSSARNTAADLALRILHWPVQSQTVSKPELIADCERLVAAPSVEKQKQSRRPNAVVSRNLDTTVPASHSIPVMEQSESIVDPLSSGDLAGGGLPVVETKISTEDPPRQEPSNLDVSTEEAPRAFPPRGRREPTRRSRSPFEEESDSSVSPETQLPSDRDDVSQRNRAEEGLDESEEDTELERLADLDLIHRLTGSSESEVRAVERELRRRGFEALELSLARRVADPDPTVRRALCENLAELPVSPGPWLFWLSYDPDPAVRGLTVALMATSQDPRLHRRLREMQSLETDDRVRGQLKRLGW